MGTVSKRISTDKKLKGLNSKTALLFTWLIPHAKQGKIVNDTDMIHKEIVPYIADMEAEDIPIILGRLEDRGLIHVKEEEIILKKYYNYHSRQTKARYDFDKIWAEYPKKTAGKQSAMKYMARSIKTDRDYADLQKAVKNYARLVKKERREQKYIKGASFFNDFWRDFVDLEFPEDRESKTQEIDWYVVYVQTEQDIRESLRRGMLPASAHIERLEEAFEKMKGKSSKIESHHKALMASIKRSQNEE
jgi:hypothetical protein